MKKKIMVSSRLTAAFAVVFMLATVLCFTGCGKTENIESQTEQEVRSESPDAEQMGTIIQTNTGMQTDSDTAKVQEATLEQGTETGSVMRAYSDKEKERMEELQQSYQNETAKPEKTIQEVDSTAEATEGTLCYIVSIGEYYLPDRELTDEELLEIIDCNFRIALNSNHKTQEEWDEIDRKERAELEARVKAAGGGISEEEAIEIAQKAMEDDLGEGAKELTRYGMENEKFGWQLRLEIADWSEIKEEDRGAIVYSVGFSNAEKVSELEDLDNYVCTVNAVDGKILEAYFQHGIYYNPIYYDH